MTNQPVFWRTADNRLISIDDMDLNHLRNALKMIARNIAKAKADRISKANEFTLNGDMAEQFIEHSLACDEYNDDFEY